MYVKQPNMHPMGNGCLCCPNPKLHAPLDYLLMAGFGGCCVTCDGELFYDHNMPEFRDEPPKTLREIEQAAELEPTRDWRMQYIGPLHGETYQRQDDCEGESRWVCIESNRGFA